MQVQNKKSARIFEMQMNNVRGIDLFEYKFENGKLVVFGKNGSGKSSIIDGFIKALGGARRMNTKIDNFVGPKGNKATIEIRLNAEPGATELGEKLFIQYQITSAGNESIKITDEETGTVHTSKPREKLNKLLGLFLDPVEMKREIEQHNGDKKLAEKLCRMVGLDLEPYVEKEAELFEQFQDENKEKNRLRGVLDSLDEPQEDWPKEYTDPAQISAELQKLNALKARNEENARKIAAAYLELDQEKTFWETLGEATARAKTAAESAQKNAEDMAKTLVEKKTDFINVKEECKPVEWSGTQDIEEKIKALMAELEEKKKHDQREAEKKKRIDNFQNSLERFEEKVVEAKKAADERAELVEKTRLEAERQRDKVAEMEQKADRSHDENPMQKWEGETLEGTFPLVHLTAKMASVTAKNRLYDARVKWEETNASLEAAKAEIKRINEEREANREAKAKAVASVKDKFPHPGITVDENTVWVDLEDRKGKRTINDLSEGEKLMICCHILIAANTGIINVLLIRDGSSLDEDNRQVIYDIAAEHGYDVVLETIETSEVGALHIVEGNIDAINMGPEKPAEIDMANIVLEDREAPEEVADDIILEDAEQMPNW